MAVVLLVRRVCHASTCKYNQSSAEATIRREVIQVQQRSRTPAFRDGKKLAADSAGNILDSLLHSFGRSRRIHPPKSRSILRKRRTGSLRPYLIVVGWIGHGAALSSGGLRSRRAGTPVAPPA